jgi:hypothetical protein
MFGYLRIKGSPFFTNDNSKVLSAFYFEGAIGLEQTLARRFRIPQKNPAVFSGRRATMIRATMIADRLVLIAHSELTIVQKPDDKFF